MEIPKVYPEVIYRPNLDYVKYGVDINAERCTAFLRTLNMTDDQIKALTIKVDAESLPNSCNEDLKTGNFDRKTKTVSIHPSSLWNVYQTALARRLLVWNPKRQLYAPGITQERDKQISQVNFQMEIPESAAVAKYNLRSNAEKFMPKNIVDEFTQSVDDQDEKTSETLAIISVEHQLRAALIRQLAMAAVPEEILKKEEAVDRWIQKNVAPVLAVVMGTGFGIGTHFTSLPEYVPYLDLAAAATGGIGSFIAVWNQSQFWRHWVDMEANFADKVVKKYEHSYSWDNLIKTDETWKN